MARIRTIKPSFFTSDDVSALPLRARLTWIGLWTHCDDAGRTKDHARLIKAAIWPLDPVSLADIEEDLSILNSQGRIVRYEVNGEKYLEITNWGEHQRIDRPTPSKIPPCLNGGYPQDELPSKPRNGLVESSTSPRTRKGKERKGKESPREPSTSPRRESDSAKPHAFTAESGDWCRCGLPRINKIHGGRR